MNDLKNYSAKGLIDEKLRKNGVYYTGLKLAKEMRDICYCYVKDIKEVYDPTCGRGNLLAVFDDNVKKYGQELDASELEVAKNNIPNFIGEAGDVLLNPYFMGKKFDVISANPPYSVKYDGDKIDKEDPRFKECGVLAPNSYADFMFLLHIIHYLSDTGVAVVLMFPGILYRKNREAKIRKWIVEQNYIDTIKMIGPGYFDDTKTQQVLIILRKNKENTDIKLIDLDGKEKIISIEEIRENYYKLTVQYYMVEEEKETEIQREIREAGGPREYARKANDLFIERVKNTILFESIVGDYVYLMNGIQNVLDELYEKLRNGEHPVPQVQELIDFLEKNEKKIDEHNENRKEKN